MSASASGGFGGSGGSDRLAGRAEEPAAAHPVDPMVGTGARGAVSGAGVAISRIENAARMGRFDRTCRAEAHWAASSLGGGNSSRARTCTCASE